MPAGSLFKFCQKGALQGEWKAARESPVLPTSSLALTRALSITPDMLLHPARAGSLLQQQVNTVCSCFNK